MSFSSFGNSKDISCSARIFVHKATRSIIEVQPDVSNIADIIVILEVLGYTKNILMKNGFENLNDFATYIYKIIDVYDYASENESDFLKTSIHQIPSIKSRITEGLSLVFPWLGSMILLFIFGISLWMVWGLPQEVTTAFIIGVFLGLAITEGLLQTYGRLINYYYKQTNIDEVKRLIKRNYILFSMIMGGTVGGLYGIALFANIPFELATITVISTLTIGLHRTSYVIIYALKKLRHLLISYLGGFGALLLVYFLSTELIPDIITRYFVALGVALAVLTTFAIYNHFTIIFKSSINVLKEETPHFYNPINIRRKTISSRFYIQLWETMPYFVFGTFFLSMLFLDRVISWVFNPVISSIREVPLMMEFNQIYHAGADLALLVIIPAAIIQYVVISPIFLHVLNITARNNISQVTKVDQTIKKQYKKLLVATIIPSVIMAVILNLFAIDIIVMLKGSEQSLQILQIASISNIFVSIFAANSMIMIFLNKINLVAAISVLATAIIGFLGFFLGELGFENIIFAYLASAVFSMTISSILLRKFMKNAGSLVFSRFV